MQWRVESLRAVRNLIAEWTVLKRKKQSARENKGQSSPNWGGRPLNSQLPVFIPVQDLSPTLSTLYIHTQVGETFGKKKKKKHVKFATLKFMVWSSVRPKKSVQTLSPLLPASRSYCRDQSSSGLTVQRERSYKVGQNESLHPLKAATSYCSKAQRCSLNTSCSRLLGAHQTAFHVWRASAFMRGVLAGAKARSSSLFRSHHQLLNREPIITEGLGFSGVTDGGQTKGLLCCGADEKQTSDTGVLPTFTAKIAPS